MVGRPRKPFVSEQVERRRASWRAYARSHFVRRPIVAVLVASLEYVRGDLLWHEQPRELITHKTIGSRMRYADPGASANWRTT